MAEQAGPTVAAIGVREATLAEQQATAAGADQILADALSDAHATVVAAIQRLGTLEVAVEEYARAAPALDTALGAREFQRFLIAQQREAGDVVAAVARDDAATTALLASLSTRWSPHSG